MSDRPMIIGKIGIQHFHIPDLFVSQAATLLLQLTPVELDYAGGYEPKVKLLPNSNQIIYGMQEKVDGQES